MSSKIAERIYEVTLYEEGGPGHDEWLIQAASLRAAVEKVEAEQKKDPSFRSWRVTDIREVGELRHGSSQG